MQEHEARLSTRSLPSLHPRFNVLAHGQRCQYLTSVLHITTSSTIALTRHINNFGAVYSTLCVMEVASTSALPWFRLDVRGLGPATHPQQRYIISQEQDQYYGKRRRQAPNHHECTYLLGP